MQKRIIINREEFEVRIALLENQEIVELHRESKENKSIVNNIYRGVVRDVVPGLQAAFVDVGLERNMFLHFMDIRPESLVLGKPRQRDAMRQASKINLPGRIERRGRRPKAAKEQGEAPVKRGDQIIVQVMKDEIGTKAPRVTTNLSIPGRYLVLLPFPSQEGGVSRKIAVGQDRYRLKKILSQINDKDHSFIVRTAGTSQDEEALNKDVEYLTNQFTDILKRYKALKGPGLLHDDHDLLGRMVRDAFPHDVSEIVCDDPEDEKHLKRLLKELLPQAIKKIKRYKGTENVFENYGVEQQIQKSLAKKIWLKSGGYLIIDEMEALTAIDINTGRYTGSKDQERTSLKTNLEAAEAIAEHIRLRDIGGIIVIDFIDMLSRDNQENVAETLKKHLRRDRAKLAVGRMGDFGIMMLTRKRRHESLIKSLYCDCPYCEGSGRVERSNQIFRRIKYDIKKALASKTSYSALVVTANPEMARNLEEKYSETLEALKGRRKFDYIIRGDYDFHIEEYQITPVERSKRSRQKMGARRLEEEERILPAVKEVEEVPPAVHPPEEEEFEEPEIAEAETAEMETPQPRREERQESKGRSRRSRGRSGKKGAREEAETQPKAEQQPQPKPQRKRRSSKKSKPEPQKQPEPQEQVEQKGGAAETQAKQDSQQSGEPKRRKRRRESSAERRARRRRAKLEQEQSQPDSEPKPKPVEQQPEDQAKPTAEERSPAPRKRKPRPPRKDQTQQQGSRKPEAPKQEAPTDQAADSPEAKKDQEPDKKKTTRRRRPPRKPQSKVASGEDEQ